MSECLRVLLVEDSPTDELLVLRHLRKLWRQIDSKRVEDEAEMRAALMSSDWDVIVSDWALPRFSGSAALALRQDLDFDIPFIIVSGTIGEEVAAGAMRAGAQDFVLKDRLARLGPAIAREIDERAVRHAKRAAEQAARASEIRYRRIVETTNQGVWIVDSEGRTTFVNRRMAKILSYDVNEMMGRPIYDFVDASEAPRVARSLERLKAGGSTSREVRFRRKTNSLLWGFVESTPIFDNDGQFEGALAMVLDVTENKETVEALRLSEARFARLAESGIIGIAYADVHGTVHDANEAYCKMFGYTREDVAAGAMSWGAMTPPEWAHTDAEAVRLLASTGVAPPWEKEMFAKDGRPVPVLIGVAMLDPPDCIAFVADLTERKRAEAALRKTEEQFRQAQRMEAVGRLAGGIAHDFNNLLSVIIGYADLARAKLGKTDPLFSDLSQITAAGERAASLTNQLLAFSRRQILQPKVVDLNAILAGMEQMLHRLIGEDVELALIPGKRLQRIHIDPGQLEQVVMNLVVNARDAMPHGGKLTIETANILLDEHYASTHAEASVGAHVRLSVADTGVGIGDDVKDRIFEPFFTTKDAGKGTGLGLSTVHGIVQQSNGSIAVYSELGVGTTLKVYLPVAQSQASLPAEQAARSEQMQGTETILLVEDDLALRKLLMILLDNHGYKVLEAESGAEALLLAAKQGSDVDLLLTDVVMPRMSGRQLAEQLLPLHPKMRVIYMSGYTDDAIVRHGVLEASMDFLQKPITSQALGAKIRAVLDRPPLAPPTA